MKSLMVLTYKRIIIMYQIILMPGIVYLLRITTHG